MSGLLERARSVFRRDRRAEDDDDGPWIPTVGPGGVVTTRPQHPNHQGGRPHSPPQHHQPRPHSPQHHHPRPHSPQHHHPRPHSPPPYHHRPPHQQPQPGPGFPGDGAGNIPTTPATSSGQLQVALQNDTTSNAPVYAYITGQAIDRGNALFLLSADGRTPYYPASPSATGQRLAQSISIPLGAPGSTTYCQIPRLAGGRIWFSVGAPLVFAVNPGPGLVEPSIFNQSDPNININFGFAEFTFNNAQVFANISYVDFVGLPIAMTLVDTNRHSQHVSGIPANGLQRIAQELQTQQRRDNKQWGSLVVNGRDGSILRVLSPNSGILLNPSLFQGYYDQYVQAVYGKFTGQPLTVDTQAAFGDVNGRSDGRSINFGPGGNFGKPTTADIFSCSSGPFATGPNAETNTIIPRLAAAFNRSTLLLTNNIPDGVTPRQYYQNGVTNHYSRIVHAANLDGHGYAFPYDDVTPDGGVPQEGAVFSYSPGLLTVTVGGRSAHV